MTEQKLDPEHVAQDLVRALRGTRSQVQLSRRLGYDSNVVYSWESGRRYPTATGFFRLLERTGVDVVDSLRPFYRDAPDWLAESPGRRSWVQRLLESLRASATHTSVAERTGLSRHAVSRWCRGAAQPRLPELLRFVDGATGRLLAFVDCFVDPSTLPSTRRAWALHQGAMELAWASPWAQVVLLALELPDYRALPRHDTAWLAARLNLSPSLVEDCLQRLERGGQVRRIGPHYRPAEVLTVNLRGAHTGASLKQHWAAVAAERAGVEDAMLSYNLFTISEADLATLRDMQRAHYQAVRALVSRSRPERLVLLNVHTVPLDAPLPPPPRKS